MSTTSEEIYQNLIEQWQALASLPLKFPNFDDTDYFNSLICNTTDFDFILEKRLELFLKYITSFADHLKIPAEETSIYKSFQYFQKLKKDHFPAPEDCEIIQDVYCCSLGDIFLKIDYPKTKLLNILIHQFRVQISRDFRAKKENLHYLLYMILVFIYMPNINDIKEPDGDAQTFFECTSYPNLREFKIALGQYCDKSKKYYREIKKYSGPFRKIFQCSKCNAKIVIQICNECIKITQNLQHSADCTGDIPFLPKAYLDYIAMVLAENGTLSDENLQKSFYSHVSKYRIHNTILRISENPSEPETTWGRIPSLIENINKSGGKGLISIDSENKIEQIGIITNWSVTFLQSKCFSKILFIDGQFSIGTIKSTYIQISTVLPNNTVFLLSCSWGLTESRITVEYAIRPIIEIFPNIVNMKIVIICDESKGIYSAVKNLLPNSILRNCAWHISLKFSKRPEILKLFWEYVKSSSRQQKAEILTQILRITDPIGILLYNKLTQVVDLTIDETLGFTTSAIAESANSMMLKAKHKDPFIFIRTFIEKQYTLLVRFKKELNDSQYEITNHAMTLLDMSKKKSANKFKVKITSQDINSDLITVYDSQYNIEYTVNSYLRTCSCNRYKRGIPCSHMLLVFNNDVSIHDTDLVSDIFKVSNCKEFVDDALDLDIVEYNSTKIDNVIVPKRIDQRISRKRKPSMGFA